jgi:hypothetical protein
VIIGKIIYIICSKQLNKIFFFFFFFFIVVLFWFQNRNKEPIENVTRYVESFRNNFLSMSAVGISMYHSYTQLSKPPPYTNPNLPTSEMLYRFDWSEFFSDCRFPNVTPTSIPYNLFNYYDDNELFYSQVASHFSKTLSALLPNSSSLSTFPLSASLQKIKSTASLFYSSPVANKYATSTASSSYIATYQHSRYSNQPLHLQHYKPPIPNPPIISKHSHRSVNPSYGNDSVINDLVEISNPSSPSLASVDSLTSSFILSSSSSGYKDSLHASPVMSFTFTPNQTPIKSYDDQSTPVSQHPNSLSPPPSTLEGLSISPLSFADSNMMVSLIPATSSQSYSHNVKPHPMAPIPPPPQPDEDLPIIHPPLNALSDDQN